MVLSARLPENVSTSIVELDAIVGERTRSELSSEQPHRPARHQHAAQEHCEAIQAVADHVTRSLAVGDSENDGSEEGEHERRAEVI